MGESSASADIDRGAEHRLQAMRLRHEGYTCVDIGVQLGIPRQRAHQLVSDEWRQLRGQPSEAMEDMRRLELARLDAMILARLIKDKRENATAIGAC
jgi:hypothetical protein